MERHTFEKIRCFSSARCSALGWQGLVLSLFCLCLGALGCPSGGNSSLESPDVPAHVPDVSHVDDVEASLPDTMSATDLASAELPLEEVEGAVEEVLAEPAKPLPKPPVWPEGAALQLMEASADTIRLVWPSALSEAGLSHYRLGGNADDDVTVPGNIGSWL